MEEKVLKTIEEIRIYSDPYRMKILSCFQKADRPSTVKEIADEMGDVPAKVYYHAKKLESIGLLKLVTTKQINGITAKYYEAFEGAIKISRSEVDSAAQKVFLSETQKLLSDLFDENKERFLKANRANKPFGNLSSNYAYLTEQEAQDFFNMVNTFMEQHRKRKSPDEYKYDIFATIVKSLDNMDNQ